MFGKIALLSALTLSVVAAASNAGDRREGKLALVDQRFVHAAQQGNMIEIDAANLALRQGSSNQVKEFARQMIREHEQASRELSTLAQNEGLRLPTTMDAMNRRLTEQERLGLRHMALKAREERLLLESMSGSMFDQAYIGSQVKDHHQMIGLFEAHSRMAADPDVQAFATRMLPNLRMHLQHARQLAGLTGEGGATPRSGGGLPGSEGGAPRR